MRNILEKVSSARLALLLEQASSKFTRDVFWNIGSIGVLAIGGLAINAIIIAFRDASALGVFNQVYAIYIVLSQLGAGGIHLSVLKQISHNADDLSLCADITLAALLVVSVVTVPVAAMLFVTGDLVGQILDSPGVGQGLSLVAPGLVFFVVNKVLINVLNGLQYMRAYAVFRSLRFVFIPMSIVFIILLGLDSSWLAFSLTTTEGLLFICLSIYVFSKVISLRRVNNLKERMLEHIQFGVRGFLSGMLLELNTRVDVLMLGVFTTDAAVGIYSLAAMAAEGFGQIPMALRWTVDPILGQHFAHNVETKEIPALSRGMRRITVPIMALLGGIAVLLYPVVFPILVGDRQVVLASWPIFSIIAIGVIINSSMRPFTGVLLQGGKPGAHTLLISMLVVGDALLNLLFIPWLGIEGAAIVTTLTYTFEAVLLYWFALRLFNIRL